MRSVRCSSVNNYQPHFCKNCCTFHLCSDQFMAGEQLQYKRGAVIYYENKERAELQKFLFFFFSFSRPRNLFLQRSANGGV